VEISVHRQGDVRLATMGTAAKVAISTCRVLAASWLDTAIGYCYWLVLTEDPRGKGGGGPMLMIA
jgi:hypothetical protein